MQACESKSDFGFCFSDHDRRTIEGENKYRKKKKPPERPHTRTLFHSCHPGFKKHLGMDGVRDNDGQIGKRLGKKGGVKRLNWTERGEMLGHMVWWEIPH